MAAGIVRAGSVHRLGQPPENRRWSKPQPCGQGPIPGFVTNLFAVENYSAYISPFSQPMPCQLQAAKPLDVSDLWPLRYPSEASLVHFLRIKRVSGMASATALYRPASYAGATLPFPSAGSGLRTGLRCHLGSGAAKSSEPSAAAARTDRVTSRAARWWSVPRATSRTPTARP